MPLTRKALAALIGAIFLCCLSAFLLVGSGTHFRQVSLMQEMEHQDTQEILFGGWRVFYHEEWDTIETFVDGPVAAVVLDLPVRDIYLMKIKARFGQVGQRVEVLVNDTRVGQLMARKAQRAERFSLSVPAAATRPGTNLVVFQKPPGAPTIAIEKITFANYQMGDKATMVLSWRASPQLSLPWQEWTLMLGAWMTCAAMEGVVIWWLSRAMALPIGFLVLLDLFSYLPLLACMGVLLGISLVSPYRLIINASWFFVRGCLLLIGLPKLYLLGVVSRRYMELVRRATSGRKGTGTARHRMDYSDVWNPHQSLLVSLGAVTILVIFDGRQRWGRLQRQIRWVGRQRDGNEPLLWFLGLWGVAALVMLSVGLTSVSEWIVNVAVIFLGAAVIIKGYTAIHQPDD